MGSVTDFEEIYKLFLNSISNDYRLKQLFIDSPSVAEDMLQTWLLKGTAKFKDCKHDLSTVIDIENNNFGVQLNLEEKDILSDLMILSWMDYNINNIVQMNLTVQDRDFKTHAEERNLAGKVEYTDKLREKVYHEISEYTKRQYPIASIVNGVV